MGKAETWASALKGHVSLDPLTQTEVQKNILLERFQEEVYFMNFDIVIASWV